MNKNRRMKLLLIVGSANDIFIYNYAKWLKKSMDVTIDVFEFYPSNQQGYGNEYYDNVTSAKGYQLPLPKGSGLVDAFVRAHCLKKFLKGKQYDIIHAHWIVAPLVLVRKLKVYCKKLVLTFWGGEFVKQTVFGSNKLYCYNLDILSRQVDCIVNSATSCKTLPAKLPNFSGKYIPANLGSAPLETIYSMMQTEGKDLAKERMNMPIEKKVVLIGYSGKRMHRQLQIIRELHNYPKLRDKVHLLALMTRGGSEIFVKEVENELSDLGFTYTLISGNFLSDEQMARTRIATDITLQLSEWDGFSRSIIECLCAKSILIYGDWLGYESHMTTSGFEGIMSSSVEDAISKLDSIVNHFDEYKIITEKNSENGRHQAIWSECIVDWVNAYQDLLK